MLCYANLTAVSVFWAQVMRSSDTSTAESGSEVEEIGSPKVTKSLSLPTLTPVTEEVSSFTLAKN